MTTLDLLLAGVIAVAALSGLRSGLVAGVWGLAAWGLGLLIADATQARLAPLIAPSLGSFGVVAPVLAFGAALLVAEALLALIGRLVVAPIRALVRATGLTGALDRILGVVPGVVRGLVLCAAVLTVATAFPVDERLRAAIDGSAVARLLLAIADAARSLVRP